ncbi:MAG: Ig-like domain-containing protein [Cytophagales bacterium]|nr:Ig-like domain-containing protein [Cytophagales bacterium]
MKRYAKFFLVCILFFAGSFPSATAQAAGTEGDLTIRVEFSPKNNVKKGDVVDFTLYVVSDIEFPSIKITIPFKKKYFTEADEKGVLSDKGPETSLKLNKSIPGTDIPWRFKLKIPEDDAESAAILENDFCFRISHSTPAGEPKIVDTDKSNNFQCYRFTSNDPPVAKDDGGAAPNGGKSIDINLIANDSDPDGILDLNSIDLNPLTSVKDKRLVLAGKGVFELLDSPKGSVRFTAEKDYVGDVSASYSIMDDKMAKAVAKIKIEVFQTAIASIKEHESSNYDKGSNTLFVGSCKDNVRLHAVWKGEGLNWFVEGGDGEILEGNMKEEVSVKVPGTYRLLVKDKKPSAQSVNIKLRKAEVLKFSAGDELIISKYLTNKKALSATSAGAYSKVRWTPVDGLDLPFSLNPVPNPAADTEYTLELTDNYGCAHTDKVKVVVNLDKVGVQVRDKYVFGGCKNNASIHAKPEGYKSSVKWINKSGTVVSDRPEATVNAGTYTVKVTDFFGLVAEKKVIVSQAPMASLDAGEDIRIKFDEQNAKAFNVKLDASLLKSAVWSPVTHLSGSSADQTVANPGEIGAYTYTLTATDPYDCKISDQVNVIKLSRPPKALNDTVLVQLNQLGRKEVVRNDSDPEGQLNLESLEIVKEPKNGAVSIDEGFLVYRPSMDFEGKDSLTYTICDSDEQYATAQLHISVEKNVSFFSKVVTPNGDEQNDTFEILNAEIFENSRLVIFNKAGNVVYTADHYQNDWEGQTTGGGVAPTGTYYYIFNFGDGRDVIRGAVYIVTN